MQLEGRLPSSLHSRCRIADSSLDVQVRETYNFSIPSG